ncbi:MAG: hypothetical protein MZV65_42310 [Chromatiales bacterium]|nr:hypothetical protein [Chromatiales bacterium]
MRAVSALSLGSGCSPPSPRALRRGRSDAPLLPGCGHPGGPREGRQGREAGPRWHWPPGSGKTFIAVNLLKRIADAGQLRRRPLRLRSRRAAQPRGFRAMQNVFRRRRRRVSRRDNPAKERPRPGRHLPDPRRRSRTMPTPTSCSRNYPEDYFSHIVIDECHRSAWGKWSRVLTRNPERGPGRS